MDEIELLQTKLTKLEAENKYLKELLDNAGISYSDIPKQTENTIIPFDITPEIANKFFSMFWGRTDVYAKRTVQKYTGKANYYPQCNNFWKDCCPRKFGTKIKCTECENQSYRKLEKEQIIAHLKGEKTDGSDVIGIYPLLPDDTCRFIVFDFDNHSDKEISADLWKEEILALKQICDINGVDSLIERSHSGSGAHLWIFFSEKTDAALARKFGNLLIKKGSEYVNLKSFDYYDRMLPMQDYLKQGSLGNLIALPLQGQALKNGNSAFVDENFNVYPNQLEILFSKQKLNKEFIEDKIKLWSEPDNISENVFDEKPWDKTATFHKEDVNGKIQIVLADGIYVDTANLKPKIQNRIREIAAFHNPVFYKNQIMGLSNFQNARYIYLGRDENGYIKIPRGLLEILIENCNQADIEFEIEDKRTTGNEIDVSFNGELKESQNNAIKAIAKYDTGILSAATAFGKTVVCCNMIAKRRTNTLILLQSSALIEQWADSLNKFLNINEEPPEYTTPKGRVKKRKSVIGKLQNAHDSTAGIIDIAMVGSLCKNGKLHPRLKEYGMVILDECHHAASNTIIDVLQKVNAKYVYGVTATPLRGDGLEKINYMLLGPIRHKFTSKDRAKEQGIEHLVYPRFTKAVVPKFNSDKLHPNEAYEIVRNNENRDNLIISDVKKCIQKGRTPVVLSKYVDHSQRLYDSLKGVADKIFILSGKNSKKDHKRILAEMNEVTPSESMLLVATGSLIGEGFDFPRLDTLIMATPVAWKGVVEQYAGRLNRDYSGKKDVIIYDYIDSHIPMFDRMYNKRLKAYNQIGYSVYSNNINEKVANANSIFNMENYYETYSKDLLSAKNEIIISSPAISGKKVHKLKDLLKETQENGVKIRIITWKPDLYGYGDPVYWIELQAEMRSFGFNVELVENYCEHYCIIDREIVWYGSMNFLGKEDAEDNLMRICSKEISAELLELTFGTDKYFGESL